MAVEKKVESAGSMAGCLGVTKAVWKALQTAARTVGWKADEMARLIAGSTAEQTAAPRVGSKEEGCLDGLAEGASEG